jgi:hypothetical protein
MDGRLNFLEFKSEENAQIYSFIDTFQNRSYEMKYSAKLDTAKNILLPLPHLFKKEVDLLEIIEKCKLDNTIVKPIYIDKESLCLWKE